MPLYIRILSCRRAGGQTTLYFAPEPVRIRGCMHAASIWLFVYDCIANRVRRGGAGRGGAFFSSKFNCTALAWPWEGGRERGKWGRPSHPIPFHLPIYPISVPISQLSDSGTRKIKLISNPALDFDFNVPFFLFMPDMPVFLPVLG